MGSRAVPALIGALTFAAALTGCTGEEPQPSSATTSPSPTTPAEPSVSVEVGDPVWRSKDTRIRGPEQPRVGADVIVHNGWARVPNGRGREEAVVAFDRQTGKERWRRYSHRPVPGLPGWHLSLSRAWNGPGPGDPVIVETHTHEEPFPEGVIALAPRSGRVRWHWRPPHARQNGVRIQGLTGGTLVVRAGPFDKLDQERSPANTTFGLDAETGDVRWRSAGVGPAESVDHGLLVVGNARTRPIVLDAATGDELWKAGRRGLVRVADATHVVWTSKADARRSLLVDLDTGRETDTPTPVGMPGPAIATDLSESLLISGDEGDFATLLPGEPEPARMAELGERTPLLGVGDLVWAAEGTHLDAVGDSPGLTVLDRTGRPVSDPLPGHLVTLGDDYLVLGRGPLGSKPFVVVPFTVSEAG